MTRPTGTLDPALESWVPVPAGSDFPIQNLPYGVFSHAGGAPKVGVAIGDHILDLAAVATAGHFEQLALDPGVFSTNRLNALMQLPAVTRTSLRTRISELLQAGTGVLRSEPDRWLVRSETASMHLPCQIGDYVDFYSSLDHATNLGRLFRPNGEPLLPNWRHLPVAYHGRTSTVVVSGTPITRPHGQQKSRGETTPSFGPSQRLDFELEVGFFSGTDSALGEPIALRDAEDHIFGFVLVNDWSARDLQAWEYVPLGPFLGKSFATTVSPWVVTGAALAPFRTDPPAQDPVPLPYLSASRTAGIDIDLAISLNDTIISRPRFAGLYWTPAQQLTHAASNGTAIRAGDLYASGTVSGPGISNAGSLIELTWNGRDPIALDDDSTRTFLIDGDRVTLHGRCHAENAVSIGFGECTGTVVE